MSSFATYYLPPESAENLNALRSALVRISDVGMINTPDGGDIQIVSGAPVMSDGLFNFVYLCLFGGNDDDPALSDTSKMWWGNFAELDPARWLRSETQYLINTLPPTTGNLRRIETAATNDLAVAVTEGIATGVQVAASMPGPKSIYLAVAVQIAPGAVERFNFSKNWSSGT